MNISIYAYAVPISATRHMIRACEDLLPTYIIHASVCHVTLFSGCHMSALRSGVCVSLEVHSIHFGRSNSGRHLHPYLSSLPTGFSFPLLKLFSSFVVSCAHLCCVRRVLSQRDNSRDNKNATQKILAMNASARVTMKDAANCDRQCELQNSVNHQDFERILRFREFLGACLAQRLFHLFCPPCVSSVRETCGRHCAPVSLVNEKPLTHKRLFFSRSRTPALSPLRCRGVRSTFTVRKSIDKYFYVSFLLYCGLRGMCVLCVDLRQLCVVGVCVRIRV